jgi:flagellar biosynthesis/type III secretory pathway M-ring protein FliF/YscJ
MNLKSKIQAAANRAANGPGDPKDKKQYDTIKKTTKTVPVNQTKGALSGNQIATALGKTTGYPKMQSTLKEVSRTKRTPMSPMPTLRPTSVSVSVEKRTAAPLAGKSTMGKTKRRG